MAKHRDTRAFYANNLESYIVIVLQLSKDRIIFMDGKEVLEVAPWLSIFPGLAILFTVLGYNLIGESLRDILDPRLRQ